ncbi:MAG: hypothetical protein LW864_00345 [Alphaproteobacteria bacterium]|nr:hypothetical protein [Alphaproteobacteria bacterium]
MRIIRKLFFLTWLGILLLACPLAASDLQSSWTEDAADDHASDHQRQKGPLQTLEEADYKQAFIYGAEGDYPDPFYDFFYGVGVRLTPKDRQDLQPFMINTHKIYSESTDTWHVAKVFCNTDRFPDTFSSMGFVVNRLVSEGWAPKKVMSLVDLRMVEIVRRGGYVAFKAILDLRTDLARGAIKAFLTPAYMDQVAAPLDLAALITHFDQKGEAPSPETLHQFPHLLKKSLVTPDAITVVSCGNVIAKTKDVDSKKMQEATRKISDPMQAFKYIVSLTAGVPRQEIVDFIKQIKSPDVRSRLLCLVSGHHRATFLDAGIFQTYFMERVAEFYSRELKEEFIDYFGDHSFKDFVQIKQVDVSKRLLKLFHPQVAQTMKVLRIMRGIMAQTGCANSSIVSAYPIHEERDRINKALVLILEGAKKGKKTQEIGDYVVQALQSVEFRFEDTVTSHRRNP